MSYDKLSKTMTKMFKPILGDAKIVFRDYIEIDGRKIEIDGRKVKAPNCLSCGKPMEPAIDTTQQKITGYIWKCECLPKNLRVSIG
jgi:hypothetical protein